MSLHQLVVSLDPALKRTFYNSDIDKTKWFSEMETIVKNRLPKGYSGYAVYDIVLAYVKWKYEKA
jgi:hypothetical protein